MDAYFAIYTCYPYYHLFRSLFFNNLQDLAYGTLPLDLRMDVCEQEISTSHDGNVRKQGRKEQRPRWWWYEVQQYTALGWKISRGRDDSTLNGDGGTNLYYRKWWQEESSHDGGALAGIVVLTMAMIEAILVTMIGRSTTKIAGAVAAMVMVRGTVVHGIRIKKKQRTWWQYSQWRWRY